MQRLLFPSSPRFWVSKSTRTELISFSPMSKPSQKRGMSVLESDSKQRKKMVSLRTSNARSSRSISYLQIFGTGMDTGDTAPSVFLFFDSQRYVFNAGEGLQRFCFENKIKLSKMDHVLLTRVCSETAGGLAGTLLTLAGEVGQTVNIWGPSDLQYLVDSMKMFLPNASFFHTHSFGSGGKLVTPSNEELSIAVLMEDDLVKISAVLLLPEGNVTDDIMPREISVVYVCELPEVTGKFDPAKAASLGLKPGKKYAQLQAGASVLSDDGKREIFPSDVMEPPSPGPIAILVDCPTLSHIPSLLNATALESFYSKFVACIVHLSPSTVINDSRYQSWMKNFATAQHILAGYGCTNVTSPIMRASAKILSKLNFTSPYVFPLPALHKEHKPLLEQKDVPAVTVAQNLLKFRLRPLPSLGLDTTSVQEEFNAKAIQEELVAEVPGIKEAAKQIDDLWFQFHNKKRRRLVEEPFLDTKEENIVDAWSENIPDSIRGVNREEMEVVFLGTGSSQPSTHRNVSAIYLHLFERGGVLLDCGEGTYGQLKRKYGEEGADLVVAGLKCVWISHIHADHHAGLARILSVRRKILSKASSESSSPPLLLLVVGPLLVRRVLESYGKLEDLGMEFVDCSQTTSEATAAAAVVGRSEGLIISAAVTHNRERQGMRSYWLQPGFHLSNGVDEVGREKLKKALEELGLASLVSVPVIHCPHAFGVVIQAQKKRSCGGDDNDQRPGWKLAYSGDTRPCDAFIRAAFGSTVFIHEATFDDALEEEAIHKKHSTTKEGIEAGVSAGAYRIILTHFSQRYPKIPIVVDEGSEEMKKMCIAFDMMSVNAADLPILPALLPALKLLFAVGDDEEEYSCTTAAQEN